MDGFAPMGLGMENRRAAVDVLVVADDAAAIVPTVVSLAACEDEGIEWRAVVVAIDPDERLDTILASIEGDVVVERLGAVPFGTALAAGLEHCGTRHVAVVGQGMTVHPGWLASLAAELEGDVVGVAAVVDRDGEGDCGFEIDPYLRACRRSADAPGPPAALSLECALFDRASVAAVGVDLAARTAIDLAVDLSLRLRTRGGALAASRTVRVDGPADLKVVETGRRLRVLWHDSPLVTSLPVLEHPHPTSEAARMSATALVVDGMVSMGAELLGRGEGAAALRVVEAASHMAWFNHTGRFVDTAIESFVVDVGARLAPVAWQPSGDGRRRVLHVLTVAHGVGGHTRLAWRWMARDRDSAHTVAFTGQGSFPVPAELESVASSVVRIDDTSDDLVERAARLRAVAASFDLVVLHVHPFDVVATSALAHEDRPPTILCNHAGHVFWIGGTVVDVVASMRPSTAELCVERRGIDPSRVRLLPSPLERSSRTRSRAAAKSELGIPRDAVVALTIANPSKYAASGGVGFSELVAPVLAEVPNLWLVAVGPSRTGTWAALADRFGGRVLAVGVQRDLEPFHEMADIALDSYPLPSTTGFLETALYGNPVVSFRPDGHDVLGADDVALEELLVAPAGVQEFRSSLAQLVADERSRRALGRRTAESIQATHMGKGWRRSLDDVYAAAIEAPRPARVHPVERVGCTGDVDERLAALHRVGGVAQPVEYFIQVHQLQQEAALR